MTGEKAITHLVTKIADRTLRQWRGELHKRIVFVHIPKCAGTALSDAIGACYKTLDVRSERYVVNVNARASVKAAETVYGSVPIKDSFFDVLKLREDLLAYFMSLEHTRFIHGHVCFSENLYQTFNEQFEFITLLRDPVERWISFFFYNKYRDDYEWKITEHDVHEFLASQRGRAQGHEYVKKFFGVLEPGADYRSAEAIKRAQDNLHKFKVIGFVEEMKKFQDDFEQRYAVQLKVRKVNAGPKDKTFKRSIIDENVLKLIEDICFPDIQVYQYALQNYSERRGALG